MQEMFATQTSGNLASWLALIVGAIALYFAAVGPLRRARRKELSFGFSGLAILPPPLLKLEALKIHLGEEEIRGLHAVNLFVMNTGNTVIDARDFEGPMIFQFSEGCRPLNLFVHEVHPASLTVDARTDGSRVVIDPLLLNPGDYFAVFVGAEGATVEVEPRARVSGISDFPRLLPGERAIREFEPVGIMLVTLFVFGVGVFAVAKEPTRIQYWVLAVSGGALLFLSGSLWRRFRAIKRARWMGKGTEGHLLTPAKLYQLQQEESINAPNRVQRPDK